MHKINRPANNPLMECSLCNICLCFMISRLGNAYSQNYYKDSKPFLLGPDGLQSVLYGFYGLNSMLGRFDCK